MKKTLIFLGIFFLIFFRFSYSQELDIKDINQEISQGERLFFQWKMEEAKLKFEKALKMGEKIGYKPGITYSLNWLCLIYLNQSNYDKAMEYYKKTLKIYEEIGDKSKIASSLKSIGEVYSFQYKNDEAMKYYEKALKIYEEIKDKTGTASTFYDIGMIYFYRYNYDKAIEYYDKALRIYEEIGDKSETAFSSESIGRIYLNQSNYDKAMEYYERYLKIEEESGDKLIIAVFLENIGETYFYQGNYDRSMKYYEKALKLYEAKGNKTGIASSFYNISWIYSYQNNYDKALEYGEKALKIYESIGNKSGIASSLQWIGLIYYSNSDYNKVREYYEKALKLYEEMEYKIGIASSLEGLGYIYFALKDYPVSNKYLVSAIKILTEIGAKEKLWQLYYMKGFCAEKEGDLKTAKEYYEKAIKYIEELKKMSVGTKEEKATAFAGKIHVYQAMIRVLLQLYENKQNPLEEEKFFIEDNKKKFLGNTYQEIAYYFAEKGKARTLIEMLVESKARIEEGVDKKLLDKETQIISILTFLQKKYEEGMARKLSQNNEYLKNLKNLKKLISEEEEKYIKVKEEIKNKNPLYASLIYPEISSIDSAREEVSEDTVILEYIVSQNDLFCFILKKDEFYAKRVIFSSKDLEEKIIYLLKSVKAAQGISFNKKLAKDIYQDILFPFEDKIKGVKNLLIIPDGVLNYLPFELLISKDGFLVERYTISYAPSVNFLKLMKRESKKGRGLLAFGDPAYDESVFEDKGIKSLSGGYFKSKGVSWHKLPGTKREVEKISKLYQGKKEIFLGSSATEETVKKEIGNYSWLHFATHGMLDDLRPILYSSLIFAGANSDSSSGENDGYLRAIEIFNLKIDADMVVLSACETGLGKVLSGEGLLGLATSFFYAGAKSMVVSLWSVEDESTAKLFEYFYENLKTGEWSKVKALRLAKLKLMKEKESPFFWAPFILIGK